ncbi:hypothetical protein PHMEG_00028870 [Phytophthora megakarya]|uniref:PiggyBac transposable element-derived protein domain-containing protein n=1 Tax=Phytophthora megakarya TaxID=4795 RepID=A0A225V537_9STRA|nr:hypothetical protein PHMEG_00028870 [Phytophthora megakarya]
MIITQRNEIADYWSGTPYLGQREFHETMAQNRFKAIRSHFRILYLWSRVPKKKSNDHLWHSRDVLNHLQKKFQGRYVLNHLQKKFQGLAVPTSVSSLDESSVRTRAHTKASSYMPLKPDKYAIRFYAIVGWDSLYIHSLCDTGLGLVSELSPGERYVQTFPILRESFLRLRTLKGIEFDGDAASSVWVAMAGHQTKILRSKDGKKRLNSKERVEAMERGSWELVAAVDPVSGREKMEEKHNRSQPKIPKRIRIPFPTVAPVTIASHAGYIVFKDSRTIIFYTNDLTVTMSESILSSSSQEAVRYVHGLHPIARWTGAEMMHMALLYVPVSIAAFNKFMNAVDRVDQLRSTNSTQHREVRLTMTLFTWALDICIINAFALKKRLETGGTTQTLRQFKLKIVQSLTEAERQKRVKTFEN